MIQKLNSNTFKTIVIHTPLVSIDLIICNSKKQILLGLRTNRPAQGYWFVPGGRICKDETFDVAFQRLTKNELGVTYDRKDKKFIGYYQHFYQNNFSDEDFTTHYVVISYLIEQDIEINSLPLEQHKYYKWWDINKILSSPEIHENTKAYFLNNQYHSW